ncbi:MAG: hypothetical protein ACLQF0_09325 [Dissulfurispiraceae bacterium]
MLLAVNLGIANQIMATYSDTDKKVFITRHSLNTNKYIKVVLCVFFVVMGKCAACEAENNGDVKIDGHITEEEWVGKVRDSFHQDLSYAPYKEELLNLTLLSRLTDFPQIKGDTVGYSIANALKIPVRIIDGIEDQGFAAESLLNDDGEPEIRFSSKFLKYLYEYHADVFDIVFKFIMYHETGHVINRDIYKFSIFPDLEAEIKADSYAAERLSKYCGIDLTVESFLCIHQIYNAFIDHYEDSDSTVNDIAMRLESLTQYAKYEPK